MNKEPPRTLIIGGGIIGMSTAMVLCKSGHHVTLVEQEAEVGQATSHENNCQFNYSKCESWVSLATLKKLVYSIFSTQETIVRVSLPDALYFPDSWKWIFNAAYYMWFSSQSAEHNLVINMLSQQYFNTEVLPLLGKDLVQSQCQDSLLFFDDYKSASKAYQQILKRDAKKGMKVELLNHKQIKEVEPFIKDHPTYRFGIRSTANMPQMQECSVNIYKLILELKKHLQQNYKFEVVSNAEVNSFIVQDKQKGLEDRKQIIRISKIMKSLGIKDIEQEQVQTIEQKKEDINTVTEKKEDINKTTTIQNKENKTKEENETEDVVHRFYSDTLSTVIGVSTSKGDYLGSNVIICAGNDTSRLIQTLGKSCPILPLKGQTITVAMPPNRPALRHMICDETGLGHVSQLGQYLRHSNYGQMEGRPSVTTEKDIARLVESVKSKCGMEEVELIRHWSGYRPVTPDDVPVISRVGGYNNVVINAGHGGRGLIQSFGSALLVQDILNYSGASMLLNHHHYTLDRFFYCN